jgi:hypothetical protein
MINKIKNASILFYTIIASSCQVETNNNPCGLPDEVTKDLNVLDSIVNDPQIITRRRQWMKNNYNETSILDAKNETYRFIWSSSFNGTEIYTIRKTERGFTAIKKIYKNHEDTIGTTKVLIFSESDWIHITTSLSLNNFWTYPSTIKRQGLDGSSWSLSAYKPIKDECTLKNLHNVSRWSPIDTTFIKMCDLFYDLKERKINNHE